MLCDSNYLHFALALLMSIKNGNIADLFINFLCLDDKTYNVISNLEMYDNIKCYREDIMLISQDVNNLKNTNKKYYLWSLASLFTNYILKSQPPDCESVLYIDADVFFHLDVHILYNQFGNKDVGIFRHRFTDKNQLQESGNFNVGVVYFKNSLKGKEVLDWWADAVLFKKYPKLATCGDQKYLDYFPIICTENEIYMDDNIGHGAPWNWYQYNMNNIHNYEIIYNSQSQPLVFTHFSKFHYSIENNEYHHSREFYHCFTNNNEIYKHEGLKKIHDDYFSQIKKADDLIKSIENRK